MQNDVSQVGRKLVVGLRQVARDMGHQVEARMEDTSVEAEGFLSEAVDQYADRINGIASELAASIGYAEASPDMLAARKLAANVVHGWAKTNKFARLQLRISDPGSAMPATAAAEAILCGDQDDCDIVQDTLLAIERGRELAAAEQLAAMMAPAAKPTPPDRLTITIDGPQGSGKTRLASVLQRAFPFRERRMYERTTVELDPVIIEMRDGRPFNVRNDAFEG